MTKELLIEWPYGKDGPPTIPERMIWSSSAVKTWRTCKRQFFWFYIMGLSPNKPAPALEVGTLTHDILELFYEGNHTIEELNNEAQERAELIVDKFDDHAEFFDNDELQKAMLSVQTAPGMIAGYLSFYKQDLVDFTKRKAESFYHLDMGEYDFTGKMDMVMSLRGSKSKGSVLFETKTAGMVNELYFQRLALDTQLRCYWMACQELGFQPTKVIYNVIKKCKLRRKSNETWPEFTQRIIADYDNDPAKYFIRQEFVIEDDEIEALQQELDDVHWEYMSLIESGADVADPRTWGINDQSCNAYFRLCDYHELCTTGLDKGTGLQFKQYDRMDLANRYK